MSSVQVPRRPVAVPGQLPDPASIPDDKPVGRDQTGHGTTWLWALVAAWCVQNSAWLLSALLHAGALACVAGLVFHQDRSESRVEIEAFTADRLGDQAFDQVLGDATFELPSGGGQSAPMASQAVELSQLGGDAAAQSELDAMHTALFGSGRGKGNGEGDGVGDGRGPGLGAGFFGSQGKGKTFVYVVDMSGSMTGERFRRAIAELMRSINKLDSEQKFYVYFFNDRALPMFDPRPARGLIPATSSNKSRAANWIRSRRPSSTTNPYFALEQALEMKPEVIFFLTDGELDDPAEVRSMIQRRNTSGVCIHTVAFESEEGSATLQAIAKENKGTFRFVP